MRKLTLSVLTMTLVFALNAQVSLEHSYTETTTETYPYPGFYEVYENIPEASKVVNYIFKSPENNRLTIYNIDNSIKKEIDLSSFKDFDGNYINFRIYLASTGLFNTDDKVEFLAQYNYNDSKMSTVIFNDDGTIIFDFGLKGEFSSYSNVNECFKAYITNNGYKLKIKSIISDSSESFEIYSLGGTIQSSSANEMIIQKATAYPNPSKTIINLPYTIKQGEKTTIRIFDLKGNLLESKMVDSNFDKLVLDVSNYSSGVYFYKYGEFSQKFIVE